jgi:hypothetical protein
LKKASESFSEEDLTRFFQILLHTDEDLRRKPDARLHLEMGLLRMVNAARLAPLEEILADLEGGTPVADPPARSSSASVQTPPVARPSAAAAFATATSHGAGTAAAPAKLQAAPAPRSENAAPAAIVREESNPVPMRMEVSPAPAAAPSVIARSAAAGDGLVEAQVDSIKNAIVAQEKFLGELVGHASRWELSGGEVRLFFPTESRALAEMLQARDPMERLRNVASRILGQTVRVCVKLEAVPVGRGATSSGTRELRAKFEQDPIVRAMLERFGGQISDVKRRGEE